MSKVRDFAEIISTGVASTDVSGLSTAITNEFTSIEHIASSHIKTTLLYPAISGNITNGTAHTGTYGDTVQTDGHKYYYTNIKGSKPIKDPRIGAHFGSQRHMFKSIQLLEQETAIHGDNVYSIDGREWMRGVGSLTFVNGTGGVFVKLADVTTSFFEITGYFNAFNYIGLNSDTNRSFKIEIDGVTATTTFNPNGVVNSPLALRYVSSGSVFNVDLTASSSLSSDTTLGIHTIRISWASGYSNYPTGCELIAQDTTSTTTKSQIQIPSQNVVSYGKKFTVSGTPHYNPFAQDQAGTDVDIDDTTSHGKVATGWAGTGSGYFDDTLDTATSLGLSAWEKGGDYWRPVNGGRIVKWVDSSGNIKTSVNMMPPAGRHISGGGNSGDPDGTSWAQAYLPSFMAGAIDHSQSEVAKSFHWREFGNGGANAGTLGATYADASMLNAADDIAYVMDDGLTSVSGDDVVYNGTHGFWISQDDKTQYLTFIGTGITWGSGANGINTVAQNLPYGTHIIKIYAGNHHSSAYWQVDGVTVKNNFTNSGDDYVYNWGIVGDITFHQPKMPPIPEDAVVLADYMLMADFVPQTSAGVGSVSKGSRIIDCSRDLFYNASSGSNALSVTGQASSSGCKINSNTTGSAGVYYGKVPVFGTNFLWKGYDLGTRGQLKVDGSNATQTTTSGSAWSHVGYITSGSEPVLGIHTFEATNKASQELMIEHFHIATPTHSSSHYQTFETPFLHELVGGDRNMEQTNLVVTPDGKTWDEVTRDVSYIGNAKLKTAHDNLYGNVVNIFDEWRGGTKSAYEGEHFNKDFAIAYDRMICLKAGNYLITHCNWHSANDDSAAIKVNGTYMTMGKSNSSGNHTDTATVTVNLNRGDYVQGFGTSGDGSNQWKIHINFQIIEI